ncbi:MAG: hypothetical protein KGN40_00710 [Burkholderiales bacterium]|nr:hypothetical protein [Burkholderiales bacterium]
MNNITHEWLSRIIEQSEVALHMRSDVNLLIGRAAIAPYCAGTPPMD